MTVLATSVLDGYAVGRRYSNGGVLLSKTFNQPGLTAPWQSHGIDYWTTFSY
jgi:hypothetical protein